ncbi:MAG: tRNA epoxyqueuosine(34) reductase QueG [Phycisphaerae bacterium]
MYNRIMELANNIKAEALRLGFDLVGITSAEPIDANQRQRYNQWLKSGFAGRMDYMGRNMEKRLNPALLLDGAKSVIVVGLNYKPASDENISEINEPVGRIARYARYEDYHEFMKNLLYNLAEKISNETGGVYRFKVCVDSVPLAERALALRAGLGFIGRNHMLINPKLGAEIFLGELITDLELEVDKPAENGCTDCDRCIRACPTGALRADGQFDSRRCISYLTIEHKGAIEGDLAGKIGNRLFGCDECALACPYQLNGPACKNKRLKYYPQRANVSLEKILNMSEEKFAAQFAGSSLLRTGLDNLKRNARICLANVNK